MVECEVGLVDVGRVVEGVTGGEGDCTICRGHRTEVGWGDCVGWVFLVFRLGAARGEGFCVRRARRAGVIRKG